MGKKRTAVVPSSSDDDSDGDKTFSVSSNASYSRKEPKSRAASVPNPKRSKKSRISNACSRSVNDANPFDEMKRFCKDFGEVFTGCNAPADCRRNNKDLWLDKYKPSSLTELAVHKKKVEEVKAWLEERLKSRKDECCNHVLLISGQAGVGKSATVQVIASHLQATVCEWNTPTPTIWQEHVHTSNAGLHYMSKLDEFESFVERTRKYGLISSSLTDASQKSIILLIDDLPVINGKIAYVRVQRCLHHLVQSVRIPTVILITDYGRVDSEDYTTRCWEELQTSLQSAGACKVAFNPITVNSITKTLSKICREEKRKITADQIDVIANASGGDIRHAITSLQYFSLKPDAKSITNGTAYSRKGSHDINNVDTGFSLPFGRDETLSLFHALGKFLHNKRDGENSVASDTDSVLLRERFIRLPMKMDAPEKVLCQAHGQGRPIADFLQENVLDFLHEESMDDAWTVASYLSDADTLLASLSGKLSRNYEALNIIQSTAASVAVRGVMFGNHHPLSSRWHAIRRPILWQVEQSQLRNKNEMVSQRSLAYGGVNLSDLTVIATEWKPIQKWLGSRNSEDKEANPGPIDSDREGVDNVSLDNCQKDISQGGGANDDEDEIEDW